MLDSCPRRAVPEDIWPLFGFADLFAKGLPPVMGGSLDQTAAFTQCCRFIWHEETYWKNKLDPLASRD